MSKFGRTLTAFGIASASIIGLANSARASLFEIQSENGDEQKFYAIKSSLSGSVFYGSDDHNNNDHDFKVTTNTAPKIDNGYGEIKAASGVLTSLTWSRLHGVSSEVKASIDGCLN